MVEKIRKGDIVGRKSYNKDVLFVVEKIIKSSNKRTIVLLKGLNIRIQADSYIEDLEIIDKKRIEESEKRIERRFREKLAKQYEEIEHKKRSNKIIYTGRILHLDGECIILEKIEENAYQAYPIADLSILKLSCINGKKLHFYKKHDNIITKNI